MRRKLRLAVGGSLRIVLAGALGTLAAHGASAEIWAGVMRLLTCGVLLLSAIGAVCRQRGDRPRFVGFAAFGWGYFALAHWYTYYQGPVPTVRFVPGSGDVHGDLRSLPPLLRGVHDAWALAFGVLGMTLAGLLARHASAGEVATASEHRAGWWRKPVFVGLLGSGLAVTAALAGWRSDPEVGAGAAFLMTWCVLGVAVLGAVFARGRRREAWFGAACFGLGYLVVAFAPVATAVLPTNHLLNAVLRPGGPTTSADVPDDDRATDMADQRVKAALDEPVSLHFPAATPLGVVIEHIQRATRARLSRDLIIYAPRDELRLAPEEFNGLKVTIDGTNVPAKDALRLCLKQLGLTYRVQSGYVRILPDAYRPLPFEEDPVMIAGHSLLALIAAAMGGAAAPIVAGLCRRQPLSG